MGVYTTAVYCRLYAIDSALALVIMSSNNRAVKATTRSRESKKPVASCWRTFITYDPSLARVPYAKHHPAPLCTAYPPLPFMIASCLPFLMPSSDYSGS